MANFVNKDLAVTLKLDKVGGDGFIILGCGETCTGTVREVRLTGAGIKEKKNLQELMTALKKMMQDADLDEIVKEIQAI